MSAPALEGGWVVVERNEKPGPVIGRTFSQYEILEKIGEGGMGEVYLAHDSSLERRVALKFLRESLQRNVTSKKRFLQEAKSAARIDHAFICKVYETGELDGRSFIAMEYVRGETLEERLAREPLALDEAMRIASEIGEALETAHRSDVVHRDLKPSNIMLTLDGHVKVMDFGLAKRVAPREGVESEKETASRVTGEGATVGTLAYMSPEQLRGQVVDARSDIFSFGVVLYELLAGSHPFLKSTSMDTAVQILNREPPRITGQREEVPELLESIVRKMLAKAKEKRYASVHELLEDFGRVHEPTASSSSQHLGALGRRSLLGLVAAAVLIGALSTAVWWNLAPPELVSVAVLPLRNMSADPFESDYLADGISQAVTTKLVQVGLRVTPWATAQRYRDAEETAEQIARELNVDAALVGTFQLVGDRIVTTLSLVEAESGLIAWAEEFEEPYEDIFRMQRRIATGAAVSLKRSLTGEEEEALAIPESRSVDAYDYYLQGAHLMQEDTEEAAGIAFEYFSRAVQLDDSLAEAHVGLGAVHADRFFNGWGGIRNLDIAEESYERALELNPALMTARTGLAMVANPRGFSEASLIQAGLAARYGRPNDLGTLQVRAQAYHYGGLVDRSLPLYRRIVEIDPRNQGAHWHLMHAYYMVGKFEAVIDIADAYSRRFGDDDWTLFWAGHSYLHLGNLERARERYEALIKMPAPRTLDGAGLFFEEIGEPERAEETWRRAVALIKPNVEAYPDNFRSRLMLARLYGYLGDRASLIAEEERAFATDGFHDGANFYVADAHAKLGEPDRAVELLRRMVKHGKLDQLWERRFDFASIPIPESEAFDEFLKEYDALEQRLRDTY